MRRRQMYAEATAAPAAVITLPNEAVISVTYQTEILQDARGILADLGIAVPDANACPKCGKALKARGRHFHINKCKGLGDG